MDEPRNYHTKQSKSKKKDKYHTISFTCEILKKKKIQISYKTEIDPTDIESKLMVTKRERGVD